MMNWTALKDNKPAVGQAVLLYDANAAMANGAGDAINYMVAALTNLNGVLAWQANTEGTHDFNKYTHWMPLPEPPLLEDEQTEAIKFVADSVVSHHIPADTTGKAFTFKIAIEGKNYEVIYEKDADGYWTFASYR